ncbi:BRCA2, DNA repair associated isoform X2 [Musca autumnalis]|uniref:BRCA2, DNA repair associated isoform X2 n=1 Tax=Musca autumnalis TaxID=221902 RepID=UPI003CEECE09
MQEESISSSPSSSINSTIRNARTTRKSKRNMYKHASAISATCDKSKEENNLQWLYYDSDEEGEENLNRTFVIASARVPDFVPFKMETMLIKADRESVRTKTTRDYIPPDPVKFQTLERLVEETEFQDEKCNDHENSFFITESELMDCCNEADQLVVESTPRKSLRLVNSILEDFALSPFTTKSLETSAQNWEYSPQFILKQKPERTYFRKRRRKQTLNRRLEFDNESAKSCVVGAEDDRASNGSSSVSIQEPSQPGEEEEVEDVLNTTTKVPPDIGERVNENLLDLTTFFSQEEMEVGETPDDHQQFTKTNNVAKLLQDINCIRLQSTMRHHLNSYNSDEDFLGFRLASSTNEEDISLSENECEDGQMNKTLISPQNFNLPSNIEEDNNDIVIRTQASKIVEQNYWSDESDDCSDILALIKTQNRVKSSPIEDNKVTYDKSTDLNKQHNPTSVGFQTASAKPIHISKEAEMKALEIFKNLPELDSAKEKKTSKGVNVDVIVPKDKLNVFNTGFKTASAKPIHVSKEAEMKALEICKKLPEIKATKDISTDKNTRKFSNCDIEFQTTFAKPIQNPKQAEKNALRFSKDVPETEIKNFKDSTMDVESWFIENSHMDEKPSTSKAANLRNGAKQNKSAENYWENEAELADLIFSEWPLEDQLQTKSNTTPNANENIAPVNAPTKSEIIGANKTQSSGTNETDVNSCRQDLPNLKAEIEQDIHLKTNTNFLGFQTAGGKSVKISKKAENAVAKLLKEFQTDLKTIDCEESLREMKCKIQNKNKDMKVGNKSNMAPYEKCDTNAGGGFRTAGGKNLKISAKAKKSVENLLMEFQSNCDLSACEQNLEEIKTKLNNKNMKLKNKNPHNIENMDLKDYIEKDNKQEEFHENDALSITNKHESFPVDEHKITNIDAEPSLNGFQTAAGKKLSISAKAKQAAAKLLTDFQDDVNIEDYEKCLDETKKKIQAKNSELRKNNENNDHKENVRTESLPSVATTSKRTNDNPELPLSKRLQSSDMEHSMMQSPITTKSLISENSIPPNTSKRPPDNNSLCNLRSQNQ